MKGMLSMRRSHRQQRNRLAVLSRCKKKLCRLERSRQPVFCGGGLASEADRGHHHQNDHSQDYGYANIVFRGPFRRHSIKVCRGICQRGAKENGVPGIVKPERNHVRENRKR